MRDRIGYRPDNQAVPAAGWGLSAAGCLRCVTSKAVSGMNPGSPARKLVRMISRVVIELVRVALAWWTVFSSIRGCKKTVPFSSFS